jgi:hypothetical protein
MILGFTEPKLFVERMKLVVEGWESEANEAKEMHERKKNRQHERDKRRRLLSFQHEMGGLTDEEYVQRLNDIDKGAGNEVDDLAVFSEPEAPKFEEVMEVYNRLQAFTLGQNFDQLLVNPQDKSADELAEAVDLKVIIGKPKAAEHKYSALVLMDLPIPNTQYPFPSDEQPFAMVSHSS